MPPRLHRLTIALAALATLALLSTYPASALAQGPPATARDAAVLPAVGTTIAGRVVAWPDSAPLPGAMVSIEAIGRAAMAGRDGYFQLTGLPPGTHTLRIRQIGFRPSTLTVRVMGLAELPSTEGHYAIELVRLPTILNTILVRGDRDACRDAGYRGARLDARLAPVFDQLEQNVERMREISTRWPLEYRVARTRHLRVETGALVAQRGDTVRRRSDVRRAYAPGKVLETRYIGDRPVLGREMHVPGVADLADPAFQATHCFRYAGLERVRGELLHRIDFAPLDRLFHADVAGTIWLDASTWLLRRSTFRLTRVPVTMRVRAVEVTAEYHELRPGMVVPQALLTVETVRGIKVGGARVTEFMQRDHVVAWTWAGDQATPDEREAQR